MTKNDSTLLIIKGLKNYRKQRNKGPQEIRAPHQKKFFWPS
jgi:hypothetical protein